MVAIEFLPTRSLPIYVLCKVVSTVYNWKLQGRAYQKSDAFKNQFLQLGVCSNTKPVKFVILQSILFCCQN